MKKITNKIIFIYRTVQLGADISSKLELFIQSIRIQLNYYLDREPTPYNTRIRNNNRQATINFTGTLDEIHALIEIFIERCYDPKTKQVENAIDLGANIGLATIWFWLEFPGIKIDAYEPNPVVYKYLEKNISNLNNARAYNFAISDTGPTIKLNVSNRSFSSSIFKTESSTEVEVKTKKLDETIENIGNAVDVIKFDIEGEEFNSIKNSKKIVLAKILIGESHPDKAGQKKDTMRELISKTHKNYTENENDKALFFATK